MKEVKKKCFLKRLTLQGTQLYECNTYRFLTFIVSIFTSIVHWMRNIKIKEIVDFWKEIKMFEILTLKGEVMKKMVKMINIISIIKYNYMLCRDVWK
jgi:hypothetical protein